MSDYNNFLSHFNSRKNEDADNTDIINEKAEKKISAVPEEEDVRKFNPVTKTAEYASMKAGEDMTDDIAMPEIAPGERDTDSDEIHIAPSAPRFIKTGNTPFVAVSPVTAEEDPTSVSKYTDRLGAITPVKKVHTGYTGKINTYAVTHSADSMQRTKLINSPPLIPQQASEPLPENADEAENAPETKELDGQQSFITDEEANNVSENDTEQENAEAVAEAMPASDVHDDRSSEREKTKYFSRDKGGLLRKIARTSDEDIRQNPDQLMMEGFDKKAEEEEREKELEKELDKVRQNRISNFHFWNKQSSSDTADTPADEKFSGDGEKHALPPFLQKIADKFADTDNDFTPVDSEEYSEFNSRKTVFSKLIDARQKTLLKTAVLALIGVILFITDTAASVTAAKNNGFFTVFGGNTTVFVSVNMVLLVLAAFIMLPDLKNGVVSLLKIRPKSDTALLFVMLTAFVQNIAAFFTQLKTESDFHIYTCAAVLLCVPYMWAKLFYYDNTRQCFKAVAAKSDKSYLRRVSDEKLNAALLRDSGSDSNNVVYAGKAKFIGNFLKRSAGAAFAGMPSSRSVVICTGVSFIAGIIAMIMKSSFVYGITAMCAAAAFSFPVSCLLSTGFMIAGENKKLSLKSSFVQSYTDARDFSAVDYIVLDSSELFEAEVTDVFSGHGVNNRQAEFCAGALTFAAGGILGAAFGKKAAGLEDKFPSAEELKYGDKLGLSAWISNCRVLLGTETLLTNHNVKAPDKETVSRLMDSSLRPVYLAIEGHFTAMFALSYRCKTDIVKNLKSLADGGTNILISTNDANITEEYAEQLLGLPKDSVRIISTAANDKLNQAKSIVADTEDAGIVFGDSVESLCRCAACAVKLDKTKKTSKLICEAGAFTGLILSLILIFSGAVYSAATWAPVLLQLVWIALCFGVPLILNSGSSSGSHSQSSAASRRPVRSKVRSEEELESDGDDDDGTGEELEDEAESSANTENVFPKPSGMKSFAKSITGSISRGAGKLGASFKKDEADVAEPEEDEEDAGESDENTENEHDDYPRYSGGILSPDETPVMRNEYNERIIPRPIPKPTGRVPDYSDPGDMVPPPPKYDLNAKNKAPQRPIEGKFIPPEMPNDINIYDDALFRRYEDDNIFSGLKEDEENRHFDF